MKELVQTGQDRMFAKIRDFHKYETLGRRFLQIFIAGTKNEVWESTNNAYVKLNIPRENQEKISIVGKDSTTRLQKAKSIQARLAPNDKIIWLNVDGLQDGFNPSATGSLSVIKGDGQNYVHHICQDIGLSENKVFYNIFALLVIAIPILIEKPHYEVLVTQATIDQFSDGVLEFDGVGESVFYK